jgi:hypothetical protein
VGARCADHETSLCPQTSDCRFSGIIRLWTRGHRVGFVLTYVNYYISLAFDNSIEILDVSVAFPDKITGIYKHVHLLS